jgi:hypothetical protein
MYLYFLAVPCAVTVENEIFIIVSKRTNYNFARLRPFRLAQPGKEAVRVQLRPAKV